MIAIPIKTESRDAAVAPLFGKAKWFALVDESGNVGFWKNETQSGRRVVEYLAGLGVKAVIMQSMGEGPFSMLVQSGIGCYHAGVGRVTLEAALEYYKNGALIEVSERNRAEFLDAHHRHGGNHERHTHV